ncbi:MAG: hypothetical protein AAFP04_07975 [Myxococcota bacterium]
MKLLLLLMVTAQTDGPAEEADAGRRHTFSFELEPLQFVNRGYSVVAHYALSDRLHIGTNVFAQELSEGLAGLAFDFDGDALELEANQDFGVNLSVRYFLSSNGEGWVASLPVGYERWSFDDEASGDTTEGFNFWYVSPRVGYLWYFTEHFYVLGEFSLIIPFARSSEPTLSGQKIELRPVIPFPGIGLGFSI